VADIRSRLEGLKKRVLAQNGTVLKRVEGVVELADATADGTLRRGPVLVLSNIEKGSQLKLAKPREVTVLGALSGQVFGAYRVKTGSLLSGRLEGVRDVEVVHNMGSAGSSNEDAWIVFEVRSDPGFFDEAQDGLDRLRVLQAQQLPLREARARQALLRVLQDSSIKVEVGVKMWGRTHRVLSVQSGQRDQEVRVDLKTFLLYLSNRAASGGGDAGDLVEGFKTSLREAISTSLQAANAGGPGAALREQQGGEAYEPYVDAVYDYVLPRLLALWLKVSERFVQSVVDRLANAPMVLRVAGQLAPFFQIEYPRWRFRVAGGRIAPEKLADCNIACQAGSSPGIMSLTYTYVAEDGQFTTQSRELSLEETRDCRLLLINGSVHLGEGGERLFGPDMDNEAS